MKVDSEVIPGTIQLVDLKGDPDYNAVDHEIVLVPTPSADPDDPLNWSQRRKWLSMLCMVLYTLGVGVPTASIFSVLLPISEKTNLSLADLNEGTGYMFLMLGFGCLFWQPVALQFGKRPVYLISILGTMAVQIWAPIPRTTVSGLVIRFCRVSLELPSSLYVKSQSPIFGSNTSEAPGWACTPS